MSRKILILDDDVDFNHLLTDIFSQASYEVVSERDPENALALCRQDYFDLVVTDQKMPGLSGEEVIREIKAIKPDMPIIMVSGYLDNDTIRRLIKEGVGGVFLKPLNVFSLLKRTSALIDEREAIRKRREGGEQSTDPVEQEKYHHGLPFTFHTFPAKAPASREFAKKLFSLRNFKTNLVVICPKGMDLEGIVRDLRDFDSGGEEYFHVIQGVLPTIDHLTGALAEAEQAGTKRLTLVVGCTESLKAAEKKAIFAFAGGDGPFGQTALQRRIIFQVSRDLDDLYDDGLIEDDLYMFMGTSEIRVPALNEIREDVPLMAQAMIAEACRRQGRDLIPRLDPPARVYLRDRDWPDNLAGLKRFVAGIAEMESRTVSREDLQRLSDQLAEAAGARIFNLRSELETYRADLLLAAALLTDGDLSMAAQTLGLDVEWMQRLLPEGAEAKLGMGTQ